MGAKTGLSQKRAEEIVAEVQASDRETARRAVAQGIQSAQDQWIEAALIAEALALELLEIAEHSNAPDKVAAYLRELAWRVELRGETH